MNSKKPPIAVVGIGALFPDSPDKDTFWKNILRGTDLISDVPESHWLIDDYYDPDPSAEDKTYGKRGGFLQDTPFDPVEWGIPPNILSATDTTQLLALVAAKMCLQDVAGGDFKDLDRSRTSVILGVTSAQELYGHMVSRLQRPIWVKALREQGFEEERVQKICDDIAQNYVPWQENSFPGLLGNVVAGRIANRLDLGGTNCITDAACASSFSAISMAVNELYLGDSDLVIAGGADTMNDILMYMCFSKTPALSKTGDCRPFSDRADGTLLGEGIGLFAFKRLEDAERDGDSIYAVIRGVGSSSDGRSKSIYAPLSEGQSKAIQRAYEKAGFGADTVELIEAHGTGTKAGDAAEFGGLCLAFNEAQDVRKNSSLEFEQWCALGSVKSQVGHSKAAAGAAGLFKAIMAVHHGVLPPTIKVDRPNPSLNIEQTPFFINSDARPWITGSKHPRRAGVSSFGFGGSNFHLVVEQYCGEGKKALRQRSAGLELLLCSASSKEEITSILSEWTVSQERLAHVAQQSLQSFVPGPYRVALLVQSLDELHEKSKELLKHIEQSSDRNLTTPSGLWYRYCETEPDLGKIAVVFPGQGSQYVNMGADTACTWEIVRKTWDEASEQICIQEEDKKIDLHRVVFPPSAFSDEESKGQAELLTNTQWAQPAIGAHSLSLYRLLESLGLKPQMVGGHSYGEITALHVADVVNTETFFNLSKKRGALMAEAAQIPGSMSAVKASASKLQSLLDEWKVDVVIANHNSPVQSVISGTTEDIERVEGLLHDAGVTAQRLKVATAFHSKVVGSAVKPFKEFLNTQTINPPQMSVYANSSATLYPEQPSEIRSVIANQVAQPVRFVEQIEAMYEAGARTFLEVGPKSVLSKLIKRILRKKPVHIVSTDRPGKEGIWGFLCAVAEMALIGLPLQYEQLWSEHDPRSCEQKPPQPKLVIPLNGSNYGNPYPPKGGAQALPKPNLSKPKPTSSRKNDKRSQSVNNPTRKEVHNKSQNKLFNPNTQHQSRGGRMSEDSKHQRGGVSSNWVAAFQAAQQHTAQAHIAYQQAMSQAHMAYLQAAQSTFNGLAQAHGVPTSQLSSLNQAAPLKQSMNVPQVPNISSAFNSTAHQEKQEPLSFDSSIQKAQPQKEQPKTDSLSTFSEAPQRVEASNIQKSQHVDITDLLLEVVADKTGYPAESLNMGMSLEGDLGVDSIKRVEILSELQDRAPQLPEVDGATMASLQTLEQIVAYLQDSSTQNDTQGESLSAQMSNEPLEFDLATLLLEVVADKTGYPAESLNMGMSLEGDL
ncbi:MAG: hypothetical protein CMK59_02870, partial [Proteobacteria bacterium]|nr:hypothetical protein [Pseudomonadota bacterium]